MIIQKMAETTKIERMEGSNVRSWKYNIKLIDLIDRLID